MPNLDPASFDISTVIDAADFDALEEVRAGARDVREARADGGEADALFTEYAMRDGEDERAVDAARVTNEDRAHPRDDLGEAMHPRIVREIVS